MDGRPRPTFGCLSVRRLLDVYVELETPSTLCTPTLSSFVNPCGLGEGEPKFIFNLVTTPASGRGVITESFNANSSHD